MTQTVRARDAEEALEPELPLVDAHHHLASAPLVPYGPQRAYLRDQLAADLAAGHDVRATVHVECGSGYDARDPDPLAPVAETSWVLAQRRPDDRALTAVVGYADVRLGADVAPVLEAHQAVAGSAFAGVRTRATWDANPAVGSAAERGLLAGDAAHAAAGELARRGLVLEAWVWFHQLGDLVRIAAGHPELTVVVDHLGSPLATGPYAADREEVLARWRAALRTLAAFPNVVLKLGGIGMRQVALPAPAGERPSSRRLAGQWGPELLFCIDLFGPDRCMFESNFPVDSHLCDYVVLWNAFKRATTGLSPLERAALFHDTAARVYRLPLPPPRPETVR